jgi:hypothetical protein
VEPEKMLKKKISIDDCPPLINDVALWFVLVFAICTMGAVLIRLFLWI